MLVFAKKIKLISKLDADGEWHGIQAVLINTSGQSFGSIKLQL